jgi:hypothetical protein
VNVERIGKMMNCYRVWKENLNERDYLGDLDVNGQRITMKIKRIWCEVVELINQAHDRVQ